MRLSDLIPLIVPDKHPLQSPDLHCLSIRANTFNDHVYKSAVAVLAGSCLGPAR